MERTLVPLSTHTSEPHLLSHHNQKEQRNGAMNECRMVWCKDKCTGNSSVVKLPPLPPLPANRREDSIRHHSASVSLLSPAKWFSPSSSSSAAAAAAAAAGSEVRLSSLLHSLWVAFCCLYRLNLQKLQMFIAWSSEAVEGLSKLAVWFTGCCFEFICVRYQRTISQVAT